MKKFLNKSALLTLFVVGLVSLFAVGCGDSRDQFVFTNPGSTATTGTVVFQVQRANAQTVVPNPTVLLRFDFYTAPPNSGGEFVTSAERAFTSNSQEYTFELDDNITYVTMSAFGTNGELLGTAAASFDVQIGQTITVNLGDFVNAVFTALNVSPDEAILETDESATVTATAVVGGVSANIPASDLTHSFTEGGDFANATASFNSETGVITPLALGQNSTLTLSYTINGTPQSDTVLVRTVEFSAEVENNTVERPASTTSTNTAAQAMYTIEFLDSNGVVLPLSPSSPTVTFDIQNTTATTGLSIDDDGTITVSSTTDLGPFNVVVTWTDGRDDEQATGQSFTATVPFEVVDEH